MGGSNRDYVLEGRSKRSPQSPPMDWEVEEGIAFRLKFRVSGFVFQPMGAWDVGLAKVVANG